MIYIYYLSRKRARKRIDRVGGVQKRVKNKESIWTLYHKASTKIIYYFYYPVTMNLKLLLEMYIQKRQAADNLEREISQIKESILDSPDFWEVEVLDGFEIRRCARVSKALKKDAIVPEQYKSKMFDHNAMISKEPSTWKRVQSTLMKDYPEYISELIDTDKLKDEMPELFQDKVTNFLQMKELK